MTFMPLYHSFSRNPWVYVIFVCTLLTIAQFVILPNDVEDVYIATLSTVVSWNNLIRLDTPFWLPRLAFGVPLPFNFNFLQHPLSFLVTLLNPTSVVKLIQCVHLFIGGLAFYYLALFFQIRADVSAICAVSFLLSSSVIQPFVIDEWPSALINAASLPVIAYGALNAISSESTYRRSQWTLLTGLYAGILVACTFPLGEALTVGTLAWTYLSLVPRKLRFSGALALFGIAALAIMIGCGQLLTLWGQIQASPSIAHADHPEPPWWLHVWSLLFRPIGPKEWSGYWRVIYFGAPFGVAAGISLFFTRRRNFWPIKLIFGISLLFCLDLISLPFNILSNNWGFRGGVNFAGLLLAGALVSLLWTRRKPLAQSILALQLLFLCGTTGWLAASVVRNKDFINNVKAFDSVFVNPMPDVPVTAGRARRLLYSNESIYRFRNIPAVRDDLAVINARIHGVTMDAFWPDISLLYAHIPTPPGVLKNKDWLDVLGIELVLAYSAESVDSGLLVFREIQEVGHLSRRLYVNPEAWPIAQFVSRPVVPSELPILASCPNYRALCRELGLIKRMRSGDPLYVEQNGGMIDLNFPPADRDRFVFISVFAASPWQVEGATLMKESYPFIGLHVSAGTNHVRLVYRPYLQIAAFGFSASVEVFACIGLAILLLGYRKRDQMSGDPASSGGDASVTAS